MAEGMLEMKDLPWQGLMNHQPVALGCLLIMKSALNKDI